MDEATRELVEAARREVPHLRKKERRRWAATLIERLCEALEKAHEPEKWSEEEDEFPLGDEETIS
jgi:hypothetical protein